MRTRNFPIILILWLVISACSTDEADGSRAEPAATSLAVPTPQPEPENEPLLAIRLQAVATLNALAVASETGVLADDLPQWIVRSETELSELRLQLGANDHPDLAAALDRVDLSTSIVAASWLGACSPRDVFLEVDERSVVLVATEGVPACAAPDWFVSVFVVPRRNWPASHDPVRIGRVVSSQGQEWLRPYVRPSDASPAVFRVNLNDVTVPLPTGLSGYISTTEALAALKEGLAGVHGRDGRPVSHDLVDINFGESTLVVALIDASCPTYFWIETEPAPTVFASAPGLPCDLDDTWLVGFVVPAVKVPESAGMPLGRELQPQD